MEGVKFDFTPLCAARVVLPTNLGHINTALSINLF